MLKFGMDATRLNTFRCLQDGRQTYRTIRNKLSKRELMTKRNKIMSSFRAKISPWTYIQKRRGGGGMGGGRILSVRGEAVSINNSQLIHLVIIFDLLASTT